MGDLLRVAVTVFRCSSEVLTRIGYGVDSRGPFGDFCLRLCSSLGPGADLTLTPQPLVSFTALFSQCFAVIASQRKSNTGPGPYGMHGSLRESCTSLMTAGCQNGRCGFFHFPGPVLPRPRGPTMRWTPGDDDESKTEYD